MRIHYLHSRRLFWLEAVTLASIGMIGLLQHGLNDMTGLLVAPFALVFVGAVWMFFIDKTPPLPEWDGQYWFHHIAAISLGLWAAWIAFN